MERYTFRKGTFNEKLPKLMFSSGVVEPIGALIGSGAVILMKPVLTYALSFAAGAMIYVVLDDIVPEAQRNGNGRLASISSVIGFLIMMALDVSLG